MAELVVDRNALLESLDNDPQLLAEVVGVFLADCPGMLAVLQAGISARNPDQVKKAAHALKGSVSIFGAKDAVAAAQNLESMGRQGTLEGIDAAFSVLEREIALVTSALENISKSSA